jgi:hypothetical protein
MFSSIPFQQLYHRAFELRITSLSCASGIVHDANIGVDLGRLQELTRANFQAYLRHSKDKGEVLQGFPPDKATAVGNRHTDQFAYLQMLIDPREYQAVRVVPSLTSKAVFLYHFR